MIYYNNDKLKEYLSIGKAPSNLSEQPFFDFDTEEFHRVFDEVSGQYPKATFEHAMARTAYRLLTHVSKRPAPEVQPSTAPIQIFSGPSSSSMQFQRIRRTWPYLIAIWGLIVLGLLFAIAAKAGPPDKDQIRALHNALGISDPADQPNSIIMQAQNQGTTLATRAAGLFAINCSTNMTCSFSGRTLSLTSSATSARLSAR